ncbi:MAG TPA: DNA gyrase inhibitor YacG [Tepidisphaeraceae bacterium]|nr:DNA gyrase inhibitor YacG [Tepidisphaeraceae bacterium]
MRCPTCKKPVFEPPADGPLPKYFPFCSDRCKLIDLGRWLDGKYQVPVVDREDPSEAPPRHDPLTTD